MTIFTTVNRKALRYGQLTTTCTHEEVDSQLFTVVVFWRISIDKLYHPPSLSYQLMTRTQEHTEALPLQRALQPKTPFPSPGYNKSICLCLVSVLMCWISEGRLIDSALQRPLDNEDKSDEGVRTALK